MNDDGRWSTKDWEADVQNDAHLRTLSLVVQNGLQIMWFSEMIRQYRPTVLDSLGGMHIQENPFVAAKPRNAAFILMPETAKKHPWSTFRPLLAHVDLFLFIFSGTRFCAVECIVGVQCHPRSLISL